jgi:hypothetical protein
LNSSYVVNMAGTRVAGVLDPIRQTTNRTLDLPRRLPVVYLALGALLFVAMVGHTINEEWESPDFWVHLAAVQEFADHPLDPGNPIVVGSDPDPYLSPYTWVLGAITRATDVGAVPVLAVAGLGNLVLLLAGLYRLVTTFTSRWLAPPLALIFTLFAWGIRPWHWSGFLHLDAMGSVLPLASTFATALALLGLSAAVRWLRTGAMAELAIVVTTIPLIATSHPFTATWAAAVGLGLVVGSADGTNRRRVLVLVAAAGAGALALAWPFYPVAELPGTASTFDASNAQVFAKVIERSFLALPGVFALWLRLRTNRRDPLVLAFAASAAIYALGWAFDRPTLGRVLPGIVLILHVALADLVASVLEKPSRDHRRSIAIAAVSLGVAVGAVGVASGLVRTVPRGLLPGVVTDRVTIESLVEDYRPISGAISSDDVLVASRPLALGSAAMGGKTIAPTAPAPFVDDVAERRLATATILDPETGAAERNRELQRYDVDWLVLTPNHADRLRHAGAFSDGSLVAEGETDAFVIVGVRGP